MSFIFPTDKNLDRPDDNISANPIVKLVPLEKDELEETVVKRKKKKKKKKKAESEESVKEICKGSDCTSETSYTVDNGEVAKGSLYSICRGINKSRVLAKHNQVCGRGKDVTNGGK